MSKYIAKTYADLCKEADAREGKEPVVLIDWTAKTIDIFGGESGYIKDDPYWIDFSRATEDWWLYQLAEKNWATPMLIARLDEALRTVREKLNG